MPLSKDYYQLPIDTYMAVQILGASQQLQNSSPCISAQ